jgi:hypothetical protein
MLLRLQTADHIRLPSPVQEAQEAPAACHRARIMRFPMGDEHDALALRFQNRGWWIFSARLWPHLSLPCVCEEQTERCFLAYIPPLTGFCS